MTQAFLSAIDIIVLFVYSVSGRYVSVIRLLKKFAVPAAIIFLWWAVVRIFDINAFLFPSPEKILYAFKRLIDKDILQVHLYSSFGRAFRGFILTVIFAVPAAVLFHVFKRFFSYFDGLMNFLRSVPPLAMIPLLILWFGIDEASKLSLIILSCFFPVFLNTLSGLDNVDKKLLVMGDSLDLSKMEKIRFIMIPEAAPAVITGLRLGLGNSWRALIAAEMIAASSGIGYMILDAEEMAKTDVVYAGILTIGIMGLLMDKFFLMVLAKLCPWVENLKNE